MAITVYTSNGKVLTNSANDKWLKKKAGFVMDASNATYITGQYGDIFVTWQSPSYPDTYNGNGKQYILVNNNDSLIGDTAMLMYSNTSMNGGPEAISQSNMRELGTSTGVLSNNVAQAGGYGIYLQWAFGKSVTIEQIQAYMANVSITILD
jgi:hypothetical protein